MFDRYFQSIKYIKPNLNDTDNTVLFVYKRCAGTIPTDLKKPVVCYTRSKLFKFLFEL